MNEPKRRGRPPKAKPEPNARIEGQDAPSCPECGRVVGHYDDCGVGITGPVLNGDTHREPETVLPSKAQAYALRVWNGQNRDLPRSERLDRVRRALDGQGLSMEGVVL
jgi:hypothetical protein